MSNVNTSIRISKDDLDEIKKIAKEQDRSVNYVINEIINKFLKERL